MPFKISKPERVELDSFNARLTKEQSDLAAVIQEQSEIIEAAYEKINGAVDTYNGALADARSYIENLGSQAQSDFDDKSERWQEGERGEATREWIDVIDNAVSEMEDLEELQLRPPQCRPGRLLRGDR